MNNGTYSSWVGWNVSPKVTKQTDTKLILRHLPIAWTVGILSVSGAIVLLCIKFTYIDFTADHQQLLIILFMVILGLFGVIALKEGKANFWEFDKISDRVNYYTKNFYGFMSEHKQEVLVCNVSDIETVQINNFQDFDDSDSEPSYAIILSIRQADDSFLNLSLSHDCSDPVLKVKQYTAQKIADFLQLPFDPEPIASR